MVLGRQQTKWINDKKGRHSVEYRERSVCTVTALAVDDTGIAAALGSSGRVRTNYGGLNSIIIWASRDMGGVVQQRDGRSGRAKTWEG